MSTRHVPTQKAVLPVNVMLATLDVDSFAKVRLDVQEFVYRISRLYYYISKCPTGRAYWGTL